LNMDRGERVVLDDFLVEQDGVFEVATLPAHKGHQYVLPERELTQIGRRGIGERLFLEDPLTPEDDRSLCETRALVGADELSEPAHMEPALIVANDNLVARDGLHQTIDRR